VAGCPPEPLAVAGPFAELQWAYPHQLSEIDNLIRKALGQEPPLATARQKGEHPARLVLNGAVDQKRKAFLLRAGNQDDSTSAGIKIVRNRRPIRAGSPNTR
jgi:hypothetical protein